MRQRLPHLFFTREDTLLIAKELLGTFLMSAIGGALTGGRITEVEAYCGREDRACHAWGGRRTKRNEIMYGEGGYLYVYLCYGMHALANIVTHTVDEPHAILIRALEPTVGLPLMLQRRGPTASTSNVTGGPAMVTQALGITTAHSGLQIGGELVWVEEREEKIFAEEVIASPRIGVAYAGADAALPWRLRLRKRLAQRTKRVASP